MNANEVLNTAKELAVIPAPSMQEEKRTAFCLDFWNSRGLNAFADEVGNVILEIGDTANDPIVLLMAHTDIVFDESVPLTLHSKNGRLYCPGIGDDTVHVSFLLHAGVWLANKKRLGVSFVLAANVCEEGEGNLRGCRALMQRYAGRLREVISFDSYLKQINTDAVGSMRYRVTARTAGGHSFRDFGEKNAIGCMAKLIAMLDAQPIPDRGITTYNFGNITGGTTVNTIAAEAVLLYEFRSDRHENLMQMEKQFRECLELCKVLCKWDVETIGVRPCANGVDKTAQETLCRRAENAFAGLQKPVRYPGSTDCNLPLSMGIPAVCIGLCDGAGAHTREEYIVESSVKNGVEVLKNLLNSYLCG